ncbi:MAG: AAA family ATPase [Bacteroidales bacterium]|nr:AAA family ATPase [Bacteroidales bacterium]
MGKNNRFKVINLGPIAEADVVFGDLTILTGPQATGKTLFLETFKLVKDYSNINLYYEETNPTHNFDAFWDFYYGDKMRTIITKNTIFSLNNQEFKYLSTLHMSWDFVHYIPAQRSLALSEGRIKLSDDFINSPYVLVKFCNYLQKYTKQYSEHILRDTINNFDFLKKADINMRRSAGSSRLEMTINKQTVPYMAWSTGQRELTPLLMALDYFTLIKKGEFIVIEEPELGLHPRAIIEFMLIVLKIMQTGTKVIISTHSSTPLDFVWTIKHLKEKGAKPTELAKMFDFKIKDKTVFDNLFDKTFKTYYFAPDKKTKKVYTKDISSLDVYSEDEDIATWGGMSLSADRAGSIVSRL